MKSLGDPLWVISWTTDQSGRCTHVDRLWRDFSGQSAAEALGFGWLDAVHPGDRGQMEQAFVKACAGHSPFRIENRLLRADGAYSWALVAGAPRFDESGAFLGHVGSIVDVDERREAETRRRESEEQQAFLLKLADALRPLADSAEIQSLAARLLGERLHAARVHYGEVTADGAWGVVRRDYCAEGVPSVVGKYHLDSYGPLVIAEFRAGRTLVIHNVAEDERLTEEEKEATAALLLGAYVISPLFKNARPVALIVVHYARPHEWTKEELALISETAERTWAAVERALAEERLSLAHERLTATLRASPVVVFEQDRNLRYVWIQNPALGYQIEQVVGKTDHDLFERAEDADASVAIKKSVLESGAPARQEVHVFSAGVSRWYDLNVEPRYSGDEIVGVLCVATDVTQRKQAEEALRSTRERLAIAVDAAQMGTWDLDFTNDLSGHRSLRHDQIFGYETQQTDWGVEVARRHIVEEDRPNFDAAFALARNTGELNFESRVRWPSSAIHWMAVRGRFYFDARGNPLRAAGVNFDITDHKGAETALRESENRLSLVLSAGRLATWDWDMSTGEVVWNDEHFRMLGYEVGDVKPSFEAWAARILPRDRAKAEIMFGRALESGGDYGGEFRSLWPDGTIHWMEARGRLERDAQGRPTRSFGVLIDTTERKHAEMALNEADKRKDEFLATLAHELRNPLAPIHNAVHVLRKTQGANEGPGRTLLDMMERQVVHLVRLVDDLIEISRISRGRIELRRGRVDVVSDLRAALDACQLLIDKHNHEVRLNIAPERLQVLGDSVRLTQVFTNLVNNAAKYTPPGGLIEISAERSGDEAVVRICDNGHGIPAEKLTRVFDLFAQFHSESAQSEGGLGIGLALVRGLVEQHGGRVEAHSRGIDQGSEFIVRLPLDLIGNVVNEQEQAEPVNTASALRVVVIDDDPDVADSLRMLLETFDASVRVAYDGSSGIEAVAQFEPDLVFLDVGMPEMDGHETARRIRARMDGRAPMLVALTGWGQDEDRARTREAGFDLHLTKPASVDSLENLLRRSRLD
jgi:PAS domain S-box-containing protein